MIRTSTTLWVLLTALAVAPFTVRAQVTNCTYGLSPSNALYSTAGGSGVLAVTTQDGCLWSASTTNSWVHVDPGVTNAGSGTVNYLVDANGSPASRTGVIRVGTRSFFVNQAGGTNAPPGCTFSLSPGSASYSAAGGTGLVQVTTQDVCPWNVSPTNTWIHLNSSPTNTGSGAVAYAVDANPSSSPRTGSIRIATRTFIVSQGGDSNAPPPCTFSLSPANANYSASGGTGVVAVATQEGCAWAVSTTNFWLHVDFGTNVGNGSMAYAVEANSSTAQRVGYIRIDGQNFVVIQGGNTNDLPHCTFALSPANANYSAAGGTGVVAVTTQEGCAWAVSTTNFWLHVDIGTNVGSGSVIYGVDANSSSLPRTGSIRVDGQNFIVSQAGASNTPPHCTFTLSQPSVGYGPDGGTGVVAVTTQDGCAWAVSTTNFWLHVYFGTNVGSGSVVYGVDANTASFGRTGFIHIDGQNFVVTQGGVSNTPPHCTFTLSPTEAGYSPAGGTGVVAVATQQGCAWLVSTTNFWLHVDSSTNVGSGSVAYGVDVNTSSSPRTGSIRIDGQNFVVAQGGVSNTPPHCTFTLSPTEAGYNPASGTGVVAVATQDGCTWLVFTTNFWLHVASGTNVGSGSVVYGVDANSSSLPRTGSIRIDGQNFIVSQAGVSNTPPHCTFTLSQPSAGYGPAGGTGVVSVTTQDGCSWAVSTTNLWLHTESVTHVGNGPVVYRVDANTTAVGRTGFIHIDGQNFVVIQGGNTNDLPHCTFALSPTSGAIGYGGGTGTVSVTTQSGCAWSVAKSNDWITILSGVSGSGGGTVRYQVAPNPTEMARSGFLSIGGQPFFISQSPAPVEGAVLLTFDDLASGADTTLVPNGYGSLRWSGFGVLNGANRPVTEGYRTGMISPNNVAYNIYGNPASISCGTSFNLESAYLTAAFVNGLQVEVQGFAGPILAYDRTYTLNPAAPTLINFHYTGVDQVRFIASPASQFVVDNLNVTLSDRVPPRSTVAIGPVQTSTIGHSFNRYLGPPANSPPLNTVLDYLLDQDQSSGGGGVLPTVSVDWDTNNQFAVTVSAPAGQKFLVHVPAGRAARFGGYLWWESTRGGNSPPGSTELVSFENLEGTAPDFSESTPVLSDSDGYFGFLDVGSSAFTNDIAFTSVTFAGTVMAQHTGLGALDFVPHHESSLQLAYTTTQTNDPGRFVSIVPAAQQAVTPPAMQLVVAPNGDLTIKFTGILQYGCTCQGDFEDVPGNPQGTYVIPKAALATARYFRARSP